MNSALQKMLARYECHSARDYENALKEIIQEIALLGLWRAKFFEHAAFYGGTALRILYGLRRFSEDLDFSLLNPQNNFRLDPYHSAVAAELESFGFDVHIEAIKKNRENTNIESAFIKAGTRIHFIEIDLPAQMIDRIQKNEVMKVKFEVDINPPGRFSTESRFLLQPIPFSVTVFRPQDLFAGKMHALLFRKWKKRVKGRDWYDWVWFVGQNIPVHLRHLEERMRQSGHWNPSEHLQEDPLRGLIEKRIEEVDIAALKREITPFLRAPDSVDVWSKEFFREVARRTRTM